MWLGRDSFPRKGFISIIGSKTGFHMTYLNLVIKVARAPAKVVVVSPCTNTKSGLASASLVQVLAGRSGNFCYTLFVLHNI